MVTVCQGHFTVATSELFLNDLEVVLLVQPAQEGEVIAHHF
jgi:hypothetical protein